MKYIDADKLKKIVEQSKQRALGGVEVDGDMYCDGRADAFVEVLLEIDSLQQEQPEVDIEKEIVEHAINMPHCEFSHDSECSEHEEWAMKEFRHFYELGINARKEESK